MDASDISGSFEAVLAARRPTAEWGKRFSEFSADAMRPSGKRTSQLQKWTDDGGLKVVQQFSENEWRAMGEAAMLLCDSGLAWRQFRQRDHWAATVALPSNWRICATAQFTFISEITFPISGEDFRASPLMPFL